MDENKTEQTIGGCEKTETIVMRSKIWMLKHDRVDFIFNATIFI